MTDARKTLTPQLRTDLGETELVLVDLGAGRNRLGGSALAQVHGQLGDTAPDLDDPTKLKAFFAAIQELTAKESSSPTTTVPTAGSSPHFAKWCSRATPGSPSTSTRW